MARRPSFTALKALEALVRCGSIHKAADDIHVSPGAISQQIRILESELGWKLFDRNARSMKPTVDAQELAEEISGAFEKVDQALQRLTKISNKVHLKISTLPSVATRIVLPRLSEVRDLLPEAHLSFNYIHRIEDVNHWDADVLICAVDSNYEGAGIAQELFSGEVRPFASVEYLKRNGPFGAPSDVAKSNLLHDFNTKAWRSWFDCAGIESSGAIDGDVFEDFELLIHATLADQGIALCPLKLISNELEAGKLQPVLEFSVLEDRKYVVVVPEQATKEATIFADWLVQSTNSDVLRSKPSSTTALRTNAHSG